MEIVFLGVYFATALAVYLVYRGNDLLVYPGGMALMWPFTVPFIVGCHAYFGVFASRKNIKDNAKKACEPTQEQPQAEKRTIEKVRPAQAQSELTPEPAALKEKPRVPKINKPVTQEKISEVNVDEIEIDI